MKETGLSCLITRLDISALVSSLIGKLEIRFLGIPNKEKDGRVGNNSLWTITI